MKNIINKSFLILKNNLIFTQPILIYFLLLLAASQHLGRPNTQLHPPILMALSVFLLAAATISGLFHINKNALSDYNPNDDKTETARKSIKNLKTFFAGTGEHFLKVMSGTMLYSLIFFGFIYTIIIYLTNTIGIEPVQILIKKLGELETANQINEFASSLSRHDLLVINIWSLFFVVSSIGRRG